MDCYQGKQKLYMCDDVGNHLAPKMSISPLKRCVNSSSDTVVKATASLLRVLDRIAPIFTCILEEPVKLPLIREAIQLIGTCIQASQSPVFIWSLSFYNILCCGGLVPEFSPSSVIMVPGSSIGSILFWLVLQHQNLSICL